MKTKHITLKENESLKRLAARAKDSISGATDFLLSKLFEYEILEDEQEFCGRMLIDIINDHPEQNITLTAFILKAYGTCFAELLDIIQGIQIWGLYDDCYSCGCEMHYQETRTNVEPKWKECPNCGFELYTGSEYDPDEKRDSLINCCLN